MKGFATAPLLLLLALMPAPVSKDVLNKITRIYVRGDNPAAAYIRGKLENGFQCLELARQRKTADAVLQMHASETGLRGMLGEKKNFALVSGLLENRLGAHLWDFTQRTPGTGIERGADAVLKKLAKDCDCKKRLKANGFASRAILRYRTGTL